MSKSTNERSDYRRDRPSNDYLDYDFDFKNEEEQSDRPISEQNEEEDSTLPLRKDLNDF